MKFFCLLSNDSCQIKMSLWWEWAVPAVMGMALLSFISCVVFRPSSSPLSSPSPSPSLSLALSVYLSLLLSLCSRLFFLSFFLCAFLFTSNALGVLSLFVPPSVRSPGHLSFALFSFPLGRTLEKRSPRPLFLFLCICFKFSFIRCFHRVEIHTFIN